jgi:GT2 family glycosyltransferase
MKSGFVFTNYNNSRYTKDVIYSLSKSNFFSDIYIVIVDNKSEDKDIENLIKISQDYPSVKIIFNQNNLGYFKGLNIGIKYLRDYYSDINYITVGNNDLFFPSDYIESLKNKISLFNKFPIVSPDLITLDGVHQNPHVINKISKVRELIYDIYYFNFYLSLMIGYIAKITKKFTDRRDEEEFDIAQSIHQGYGACYILGPVFFKHFDLLWAPTFLMGEEFFLSIQLQKVGHKVYYEPSIKVNHHDHATMGKLPSRKLWEISRDSHKIKKEFLKRN